MKRISALLLSLLLALSLAGCGHEEEVAGAVLDAAINAVENYESSDTSSPAQSQPDSSEKEVLPPEATNDEIVTTLPGEPDSSSAADTGYVPDEGEYYYDLENVVLYLDYYGELPDNYITKDEARTLGWDGGTPERYLEGAAIGGDRFGNREGLLPKASGRTYTECDLNTDGASSRGAERLVFSNDGLYFHTEDHYESFTEVWVENGEVVW